MIHFIRHISALFVLSFSVGPQIVNAQLTCPPDTTITCYDPLEPDIIGAASGDGYESIFFDDNITQSCPDDIIIERTWR